MVFRALRPDFTLRDIIIEKRKRMSPGMCPHLEVMERRYRLLQK